ncbi:hypothetical protein WICPIJ_005585 [Wickerhamomyces pijperi]|uniref:Uncharacterized protein n=1 Tax=Wickerhamomyces pijperi TaxID=599730 RepID=A0A9P8Q382_WICPI|nr:hypothetical protein WICPIJ_005585 [Wickerhamomyces pijperi]
MDLQDRQSDGQGDTSEQEGATWGNNESSKATPVTTVDTVPDQKQLTTIPGVAVVDGTEDEDGQKTTQPGTDHLPGSQEVEVGGQTKHNDWDDGGR